MTGSRSWLLVFYPRAWRERYGSELLGVLEDESEGKRTSVRAAIDVIVAGVAQRLRSAGLLGDEQPRESRVRAGLLLVLCSWAAFVIPGLGLQKTAEHWQAVVPGAKQALPTAAFDTVLAAAAIGSVAVLLGILLVTRPLLAFLGAGGWPRIRRPVVRAIRASALTAILLAGVVVWAHRLSEGQRNGADWLYGGAVLLLLAGVACSLALWARAAVVTAGNLRLRGSILRLETWLAGAVTLSMATVTGAGAAWWISVANGAPDAFGSGFPWRMAALSLTMILASGLATAGTVRSVRTLARV